MIAKNPADLWLRIKPHVIIFFRSSSIASFASRSSPVSVSESTSASRQTNTNTSDTSSAPPYIRRKATEPVPPILPHSRRAIDPELQSFDLRRQSSLRASSPVNPHWSNNPWKDLNPWNDLLLLRVLLLWGEWFSFKPDLEFDSDEEESSHSQSRYIATRRTVLCAPFFVARRTGMLYDLCAGKQSRGDPPVCT